MKILTGSLRGKTIPFHANPNLRATSDKARKAIFDMLQGQLEGKNVLDLFSGTGALGLEALSGGVERVVFVEKEADHCDRLKGFLNELGLTDRISVVQMGALEAIRSFSKNREYFDIIFMDPPYDEVWGLKVLEAIAASKIFNNETLIFLECRKKTQMPKAVNKLVVIKSKIYGDTKILIYRPELM